jgi:hypothetical protein
MERLWKQAGATGGSRTQMGLRQNGSDKPKPLPPVATSAHGKEGVRRFEPVRGLNSLLNEPVKAAIPIAAVIGRCQNLQAAAGAMLGK